jgi:C-1 hydroxylase
MSSDVVTANKALVQQLIDRWNVGDLAGMMSSWSPDMVHHSRGEDLSRETVAAAMAGLMQSFPGLTFEVHEMIAEGDKVASLITLHATHTGEFMGVPPTGRTLEVTMMGLIRIVDGQVVEHWGAADGLALLQQLGLIPDELLSATA